MNNVNQMWTKINRFGPTWTRCGALDQLSWFQTFSWSIWQQEEWTFTFEDRHGDVNAGQHAAQTKMRMRLQSKTGSAGSYLEVRLGQWQQGNGLGHGWVAGLEDGRQEGGQLGLWDIRETGRDTLQRDWGCPSSAVGPGRTHMRGKLCFKVVQRSWLQKRFKLIKQLFVLEFQLSQNYYFGV